MHQMVGGHRVICHSQFTASVIASILVCYKTIGTALQLVIFIYRSVVRKKILFRVYHKDAAVQVSVDFVLRALVS